MTRHQLPKANDCSSCNSQSENVVALIQHMQSIHSPLITFDAFHLSLNCETSGTMKTGRNASGPMIAPQKSFLPGPRCCPQEVQEPFPTINTEKTAARKKYTSKIFDKIGMCKFLTATRLP
jgi:hypothetical protein